MDDFVLLACKAAGFPTKEGIRTDEDAMNALIESERVIREAERQLEFAKKFQDGLKTRVRDYFSEQGQNLVRRRGATVSLAVEYWPKRLSEDMDERLAGYHETSHLAQTKCNMQSVRSWLLNDCERNEEDTPVVPEELAEVLGVSEVIKVKVKL